MGLETQEQGSRYLGAGEASTTLGEALGAARALSTFSRANMTPCFEFCRQLYYSRGVLILPEHRLPSTLRRLGFPLAPHLLSASRTTF